MAEAAPVLDARPPRRLAPFLDTKQHRRFVEFADSVRRHRYIGACYGAPGLGKTLSARQYAAAHEWEQWQHDRFARQPTLPEPLMTTRTAMFTPNVTITPRELDHSLSYYCGALSTDIRLSLEPDYDPEIQFEQPQPMLTEMLVVDEADRLKTVGLEILRDYFDSHDIGVILIGMPGFERRLARYPQLYSRIGFVHQYRPLDAADVQPVLARYWNQIGLPYDPKDPADAESAAAVTRITGGNFRLIERLMTQVTRVLDINNLDTITPDVIEAARETLVVGT